MADIRTIPLTYAPNTIQLLARALKPGLDVMVSELIDNSLDQRASEVEISLTIAGIPVLAVSDNGPGSTYDPEVVLRVAEHPDNLNRDSIGIYGAGMKISSYLLAPMAEIINRNALRNYKIAIDWRKLSSREDPFTMEPIPSNGTTGFKVRCLDPFTRIIETWPLLPEILAYRYSKALQEGTSIILDGVPLVGFQVPAFEEEPLALRDLMYENRLLHLLAGILPESASRYGGYTVRFGYRNIYERYLRYGFGDTPTGRLFCLVDLVNNGPERWNLDILKNGIDRPRDFFEFLYSKIQPLLEKLSHKPFAVPLKLRGLPQEEMDRAKIKRPEPPEGDKTKRTGKKVPSDENGERPTEKPSKEYEPNELLLSKRGKQRKPRRKHALWVAYETAAGQAHYSVSIHDKDVRVMLNLAHEVVRYARTRKRTVWILAVYAVWEDYRKRPDEPAYGPIRQIEKNLSDNTSLLSALFDQLNFKVEEELVEAVLSE